MTPSFYSPHQRTPYFSSVLTALKDPLFSLSNLSLKDPYLGAVSAHPRHFHMWVPPGLLSWHSSSGSLFQKQASTTRCEKKNFLRFRPFFRCFLKSLNPWPLAPVLCDIKKRSEGFISTRPFMTLNTSMRSPPQGRSQTFQNEGAARGLTSERGGGRLGFKMAALHRPLYKV